MANYILKCQHPECDRVYEQDSEFRLLCDAEKNSEHGPALLKAVYSATQLGVREEVPGVFSYADWLPVGDYYLDSSKVELGKPYSFKSEGLAKRLGLKNLWIAFSGYYPDWNAKLLTRTFKEFECQASVARYLFCHQNKESYPLLVASAGNTANGYNLLTSLFDLPLYLVVPESGLGKLMLPFPTEPYLISVKGDYSDAISLSQELVKRTELNSDGGVRNVARRAGMGVAMLNAVMHPKQGAHELFDHYFQAVGSGSGALAAWEAVQLMREDGRFGNKQTTIHLAQNHPYTPIVDSYKKKSETLLTEEEKVAKEKIESVTARVLTNRFPPYSIKGGLFDMLNETKGSVWSVNNQRLFDSARMFRECEGVDAGEAAAVALDSLIQAIDQGAVSQDDKILLHVTGGGKEIQYSEGSVHKPKPVITVSPGAIEEVLSAIGEVKSKKVAQNILKPIKQNTKTTMSEGV